MEITPETKIRDLIPKDYELYPKEQINDWCMVNGVLNLKMDVKKKFKTIDDYEKQLSNNNGLWINAIKDNFPRQYYSIILEMIADDICEKDKKREWVNKNTTIDPEMPIPGVIRFDTQEHVKYALNILGDKIGYLL